jgi:hypothetical protein
MSPFWELRTKPRAPCPRGGGSSRSFFPRGREAGSLTISRVADCLRNPPSLTAGASRPKGPARLARGDKGSLARTNRQTGRRDGCGSHPFLHRADPNRGVRRSRTNHRNWTSPGRSLFLFPRSCTRSCTVCRGIHSSCSSSGRNHNRDRRPLGPVVSHPPKGGHISSTHLGFLP